MDGRTDGRHRQTLAQTVGRPVHRRVDERVNERINKRRMNGHTTYGRRMDPSGCHHQRRRRIILEYNNEPRTHHTDLLLLTYFLPTSLLNERTNGRTNNVVVCAHQTKTVLRFLNKESWATEREPRQQREKELLTKTFGVEERNCASRSGYCYAHKKRSEQCIPYSSSLLCVQFVSKSLSTMSE